VGAYQYKVQRALDMYRTGAGSLGYCAERVGLSKRDLIREARARGIEPPFTEQTLREELGPQTEEPLLAVAGTLSGEPLSAEEIERELYGDATVADKGT
jgi:hypothetical protein